MTPSVQPRRAAAFLASNLAFAAARAALALALALACAACDRPPSADSLPEWGKADHHSTDDDRAAANGQVGRSGKESKGGDQVTQLVDLTWRQQCSSCHGAMGRGDGQLGPMVQAPDLTRPDLQKASDADIAAIIKNGRNKMPKFDLPDPVVAGLVTRIRSLRGGSAAR